MASRARPGASAPTCLARSRRAASATACSQGGPAKARRSRRRPPGCACPLFSCIGITGGRHRAWRRTGSRGARRGNATSAPSQQPDLRALHQQRVVGALPAAADMSRSLAPSPARQRHHSAPVCATRSRRGPSRSRPRGRTRPPATVATAPPTRKPARDQPRRADGVPSARPWSGLMPVQRPPSSKTDRDRRDETPQHLIARAMRRRRAGPWSDCGAKIHNAMASPPTRCQCRGGRNPRLQGTPATRDAVRGAGQVLRSGSGWPSCAC